MTILFLCIDHSPKYHSIIRILLEWRKGEKINEYCNTLNSSKQGYAIFAPFFPNQQEENSRLGQNTNLFSWILNWANSLLVLKGKNPIGQEKSHGTGEKSHWTRKIPWDKKNSMGQEKSHGVRITLYTSSIFTCATWTFPPVSWLTRDSTISCLPISSSNFLFSSFSVLCISFCPSKIMRNSLSSWASNYKGRLLLTCYKFIQCEVQSNSINI